MKKAPTGGGVAGGFVLGMGFASGWTPCIGVTLSAVLSSAVSAGTTAQGLILMIAYCLGLGLPFIALAFALERARPLVRLINSHRRAIDLDAALSSGQFAQRRGERHGRHGQSLAKVAPPRRTRFAGAGLNPRNFRADIHGNVVRPGENARHEQPPSPQKGPER